jgi:hypothetical protein
LAALDASGIRYLIVGGIAVGLHAEPRYTKDLDLLITVRPPDHQSLFRCLRDFGAPTHLINPNELLEPDFIFHFGIPPWRIDILTSIPGIDFEQAYASRVPLNLGDYKASCISKEFLILAERASGRAQDLLDLQNQNANRGPGHLSPITGPEHRFNRPTNSPAVPK